MQNGEQEDSKMNEGATLRKEFCYRVLDFVERSYPAVITPLKWCREHAIYMWLQLGPHFLLS